MKTRSLSFIALIFISQGVASELLDFENQIQTLNREEIHAAKKYPILDPDDPQYRWMDEIIDQDFQAFRSGFTDFQVEETAKLSGQIVRIQVIDGKVYGTDGAAKEMMEYLCETYSIPDVDFTYLQQDGLFSSVPSGLAPLLTGARRKGIQNSVFFIDWYFHIKNPCCWKTWIEAIDKESITTPYHKREDKIIWRGSNTDVFSGGWYTVDNWALHPRAKACSLSQKRPDLIDAGFFSINQHTTHDKETLKFVIPIKNWLSESEQLKYKYQLILGGLMAQFPNDKWKLYSGSVPFRQEPTDEMFFYHLLEPWTHYIPVEHYLEDLEEKILWAQSHDEECLAIAQNARQFIKEHVMPEHLVLFSYKVIKKYAELQKFKPIRTLEL